jgi:hypothetical protein
VYSYAEVLRNPRGLSFGQYCKYLARHKGNFVYAAAEAMQDKAAERTPTVAHTLKNFFSAPFETSHEARDFFEAYRPKALLGQMQDRFAPAVFFEPNIVESATPAFTWIDESAKIPVVNINPYDQPIIKSYKVASIVLLSNGFVYLSGNNIPLIIARVMSSSAAFAVDSTFLSADASSDGSPGGIFYDSPVVTASSEPGGISDAVIVGGDLSAMCGALQTWRDPIWVMQPKTLARLASLNTVEFGNAQPRIFGFPVFTTTASPNQIALIDIGSILLADDGKTGVDYSESATVTLNIAAPDADPDYQKLSLFQGSLCAFKLIREIGWRKLHMASAVKMDVVY